MAILRGHRLTVRMVDVRGHPEGGPHSIPAFADPAGKTVWEGSFDSEATRMALEAWGLLRMPHESEGVAVS